MDKQDLIKMREYVEFLRDEYDRLMDVREYERAEKVYEILSWMRKHVA